MSRVCIISPREHLIETVAGFLQAEGHDYSGSIVVFPGKRPAHFLRKLLAERARTSIIPPRIFSIDLFVEYLHTERLGVRARKLEAVDAVAILYEVHLQLDSKLGDRSFLALDAFLPLAVRLFGELEEVMLANLPARRIRKVLTANKVTYLKFHSLAAYYERFYEEVEKRGWITRSMMYRSVANSLGKLDLLHHTAVVLAGFYAFTPMEKRIVAHLRELDNVTLIFQNGTGLKRQLEGLSIDVDQEQLENARRDEEPELHFTKAPDLHGQVLALASALQERLQKSEYLDERTVIVLPSSEALFPAIHIPLSLLDEDAYNISLGYPLERTPVYGFLNNLMDLAGSSFNGKFSAAAYLRFMLHPYTKNIRFEKRSDTTRIIVHRIEEFLAEQSGKLLFSLEELEQDESLTEFILQGLKGTDAPLSNDQLRRHIRAIHDATIRTFLRLESLGDFARRGIEVLSYVFDNSTANLHPFFRPYAQQLIEVLDSVARSLLSDKRFETSVGYFTFFRQYIAAQSVPFPGTPLRGVQVLGLLETRNLKFDSVYILDANDDVIPAKPADDLLLPQPIRKMLSLETNQDRELLTEYYFNLVIEGAKEARLFYTETQMGQKEKSRFVEKLLWSKERKANMILTKELEQVAKYGVSLVNRLPDPVQKTERMVDFLRRHNFSASQLDTYLACPLRFYYQVVLKLKEKIETSDDLDQRDIGELVHRILTEFFKPVEKQRLAPDQLDPKRLDEVIDRCFAEEYGTELIGPAHFFRRQVHVQLRKLLEQHQLPLLKRHTLIVTGTEVQMKAEKRGLSFVGRIDRVETRDSKVHILDYKTGKDGKRARIRLDKLLPDKPATWRDAIGSFQLPMYMLLYSKQEGEPIENIAPAYLFLGSGDLGENSEIGIETDTQTAADVYGTVEDVMFKMIDQILDATVPFAPTRTPQNDCPGCSYSAICGTQWVRR